MSKVMEYISYIFNDIATIPRLTIALSIAFGVVILGLFVTNLMFSAMAKVRRANAKTKKFIVKYQYIDYFNIKPFYKKCIAHMPKRARKAWKIFEISGKPIQNTQFELSLRESVAKGGAIGFGIYLYFYIAVMALLVVAMMASGMPQQISSIYVCVCLIIGAVGLFVLGMQLYVMDKKAVTRLDNLIAIIYNNNKVHKHTQPAAVKISAPMQNSATANVNINQPCYSNLERINLVNNLAASESLAIDSIDKLNALVDDIVKQGGSEQLLDSVKKALLAVYDVAFTKPIDELKIKCIIKKLESCHSA